MLDTGISSNGDLAGRVVASADLSGEWSFTDSYGHGTFMAGLIAGSGQGGGPAGIAPGADLVDLKVAGADGATTLGQVLAAMQLADAARDRFNLRVLNVSLGAPADDPATAPLTEAAERLWADGITVVAVADRGRGIPREELDRVFEKFHRVEDPMTMTTGGTGLGLYIARELTRAMGGEIEATSAPRRGSTFTVRLPIARRAEAGEDPAPSGRDRPDDGPPPVTRARRAADPLCRCS